MHGPGPLFAGIDLEETGAIEAARQAIFSPTDGELLFARTHEGLAGPFAAAVIVDGINIIISCDEIAAQKRFAGSGSEIPPAFSDPALIVLVAQRDADLAGRVVAEAKVGRCDARRCAEQGQSKRERARGNGAGQTGAGGERLIGSRSSDQSIGRRKRAKLLF